MSVAVSGSNFSLQFKMTDSNVNAYTYESVISYTYLRKILDPVVNEVYAIIFIAAYLQ